MSQARPSRCCPSCGGLFPIPSHYGLSASVYCMEVAHWRTVRLDPEDVIRRLEAYQQQRAALRESMAALRAKLDQHNQVPPAPSASPGPHEAGDAELNAKVQRMLRFLEEPPA